MSTTIGSAARTPLPEIRPRRATNFLRRHAVLSYYVLAFGISWLGILLVVGPKGFASTGSTMPVSGGVVLVAGPAIAGLILTAVVDGKAGLLQLLSRVLKWRVSVRWYAVALLTAPLVMGATMFGLSILSADFRPSIAGSANKLSIVAFGIVLGLLSPFFEELGWSGFALPRLRWRFSILTTGVVMGVLWGTWHYPMFAGNGDPSGVVPAALVVAALLFAWLIPYRILMVWVFDRTQSVFLAYLMHAPATAMVYILAPRPGTMGMTLITPVLLFGSAFWVLVGVVVWASRNPVIRRT